MQKLHKVLSIRQPWASMILVGLKRIELRTWQTKYRGPLLIHSSSTVDQEAIKYYTKKKVVNSDLILPKGYILGMVNLEQVMPINPIEFEQYRNLHQSFRSYGDKQLYGWVFKGAPQVFKNPQIVKGKPGLFEVSAEII